jgi:WASH complex subunit strumpellin
MASLTYRISVFTESILAMETYLIGVVEVDPKTILEGGIRKEVIKLICQQLDKGLVFKAVYS